MKEDARLDLERIVELEREGLDLVARGQPPIADLAPELLLKRVPPCEARDLTDLPADDAREERRRVRRADDHRELVGRNAGVELLEDAASHDRVARAVHGPARRLAHDVGVREDRRGERGSIVRRSLEARLPELLERAE